MTYSENETGSFHMLTVLSYSISQTLGFGVNSTSRTWVLELVMPSSVVRSPFPLSFNDSVFSSKLNIRVFFVLSKCLCF